MKDKEIKNQQYDEESEDEFDDDLDRLESKIDTIGDMIYNELILEIKPKIILMEAELRLLKQKINDDKESEKGTVKLKPID